MSILPANKLISLKNILFRQKRNSGVGLSVEGRIGVSREWRISSRRASPLAPEIDVSGFADLFKFRLRSPTKSMQPMRLDAMAEKI